MKEKQNKWNLVLIALVVLTADAIRIINNTDGTDMPMLTDFIRNFLHIGLVTMWGFSLRRRIVQLQARRYLCGIAVLMVFWLNLKALKYYIVMDINADRYLWYLYYLPLVFIPLFILFAAMFLGKTEDYRLPRWIYVLYIPALLLFFLVISNDWHQIVFRFPADAIQFSDHDYRYGVGYGLVFGWFGLCIITAFSMMFFETRARRKYREFVPLMVSLALSLFYILTSLVRFPLTVFLAGDLSAACCLLFAAVLESCIYCGLIPTNTRYHEMFVASVGHSAQIVDEDYRVRYASRQAEPIPAEKMKEAETGTVMLDQEQILHNMPIGGGHAIWTEDISELTRLRKNLTDAQDELTERNAMLEYEYNLEKERRTVEEQNRLYDLLAASTQKQIDQLSALMREYEAAGEDMEQGRAILSRIAVLGSYIKRKKHLMLSIYNEFSISAEELKRALGESIRYLQLMDVRCTLFVDTGREFLPGDIAAVAYDFFEAVTEAALDSLFAMMVTVSVVSDVLRIRLTVGCKEDLRSLQRDYPKAVIEASDEEEWTLVLHLKGGDVG